MCSKCSLGGNCCFMISCMYCFMRREDSHDPGPVSYLLVALKVAPKARASKVQANKTVKEKHFISRTFLSKVLISKTSYNDWQPCSTAPTRLGEFRTDEQPCYLKRRLGKRCRKIETMPAGRRSYSVKEGYSRESQCWMFSY